MASRRSYLRIDQVICWDRGRPARKRAEGALSFGSSAITIFALYAHCGRDARGSSKSFERFIHCLQLFTRFIVTLLLKRIP